MQLQVTALQDFDGPLDLACSGAILLLIAMVGAGYAAAALTHGARSALTAEHRFIALPRAATAMMRWALDPVARRLVAADVSANGVTACSLAAGAGAGLSFSLGHLGVAACLLVAASLGDAVDGLVARASRTDSPAGALFDAAVDRYEEFFALGGLAFLFRADAALLAIALAALMGSFMVSYGSAKAEALRVPVPPGAMRRAETGDSSMPRRDPLAPRRRGLARFPRSRLGRPRSARWRPCAHRGRRERVGDPAPGAVAQHVSRPCPHAAPPIYPETAARADGE